MLPRLPGTAQLIFGRLDWLGYLARLVAAADGAPRRGLAREECLAPFRTFLRLDVARWSAGGATLEPNVLRRIWVFSRPLFLPLGGELLWQHVHAAAWCGPARPARTCAVGSSI